MANIMKIDLMIYLASLHQGQWFGFDNSGNREYENVIVHDDQYTLPTKEVCEAAVAKNQADYDALDYARNIQKEYPSIGALVVALYDSEDKAAIDSKRAAIKLKYPKSQQMLLGHTTH